MDESPQSAFSKFIQSESASGIVLVFSAILAMILANSPLKSLYDMFLLTPVEVRVGNLEIAKPLLLWINDGLMAVFFFLVGLELKREVLEGELSNKRAIILPGFGALGGMIVPALFYTLFNYGDAVAMQGWAIPTATDIAFALGILSLLGDRIPLSLKIFLASLAIFDDFGAIIIIALFYTAKISILSLAIATVCIVLLFWVNKKDPDSKSIYLLIGIVMWTALLKSGVHATLAGVILALFIPIKSKNPADPSPLKSLEHDLQGVVGFFILPVFAFANAGIALSGVDSEQLMHPVPVGIALGLFLGKQFGVFGFCWLAIKIKLAQLPANSNWLALYGVSVLCGIGFTMSLFIGSLAFEETEVNLLFDNRLGILVGSLLSGLLGYYLLRKNRGVVD